MRYGILVVDVDSGRVIAANAVPVEIQDLAECMAEMGQAITEHENPNPQPTPDHHSQPVLPLNRLRDFPFTEN